MLIFFAWLKPLALYSRKHTAKITKTKMQTYHNAYLNNQFQSTSKALKSNDQHFKWEGLSG